MGPEISCALYVCRPTYILPRFMCYSRHICGRAFSDPADIYYFPHIAYWPGYIMCEQHMSADIYFRALCAIQPTYIICCCKLTGRHILPPAASVLAQLVSTIMSSFSACSGM